MGEAAKAMNASLKKGAGAFDKTFGRFGDASDALGKRVSELVEGTKVLKSVSEDLNEVMGSLKESVEQQSSALTATLEPLKEATRGIGMELDSLKRPVSLLAGSMGEVRQQIDAAKQDFSSAQLKTTIAAAGDAAESLRRNLRSVADAVSTSLPRADSFSRSRRVTRPMISLPRRSPTKNAAAEPPSWLRETVTLFSSPRN